MNKKLYVGNLNYDVTSEKLEELFGQFGTVTSADVISDRYTGRSKGFAFVEMSTDEEAKAAIEGLDGKEYEDRTIKVNEARPPRPREDRRGGFGGGY